MVQKVIESLNVDVIKVTITDKPGLSCQEKEECLRRAFEALRKHAYQERRIREVRTTIEAKNSQRRIRRCFDTWRVQVAKAKAARAKSQTTSGEKRIEMLVNAIAERQREMGRVESKSAPEKPRKSREQSQRTRSASVQVSSAGVVATKRLEAQKIIIEEQRAKLVQQSNFIKQVQLREINEEAKRRSKRTIQVAKQALNHCDPRTRRSLVHLLREEGCRDKSITEIPRVPSPPHFLIRMEARAEARKQRIRQANEIRQRKREEEKKKEEISRREAEEKQRQQQVQAMKEAKKLRKEQEDRRLKEIEKNKRLEELADQCYKRYLFRRYILEPFGILVEEKQQRLKRADEHYGETLLIKVFSAWKNEWMEQQENKFQLAKQFHRHNLLWHAFHEWKSFALDMKQKCQVAVDFYDMKLQAKYMKAWHLMYAQENEIMFMKELKAIKHYEHHLTVIYYNMWKQYVSVASDIKDREQRRDEWRDLIKKFIPDNPKIRSASRNS